MSVAEPREKAGKVAAWLIEKGRPDEAVGLLTVWAATGGNDSAGQTLLAEALRVDPSAKLAQQAFERMEGIAGDHALLEQAIATYTVEYLSKVESEMRKPAFRRAQMGFNNNIKFRDTVFHVQTEDSGLDAPHVITHLFADGGRVIKSHKRSYERDVARADVAEFVRGLMKAQHLEMVMTLREGGFDRIIAGREIGGLQVLTEPPNVDVLKLKKKGEAAAAPAEAAPTAPAEPTKSAEVLFRLHVLRSLAGGPDTYSAPGERAVLGARGGIVLEGERFCHPEEAILLFRQGALFLEDLDGGNGVFVRVRGSVELELGDEFVIGDQLLRVEKNPVPDDGPDPDPTYFYSSPKWPSSFRVVQQFEGGALGAAAVARGNALQVGSAIGDLVFPDDPLVSEQHCLIEEQAGTVLLTDLGSRTGVFVRVRGQQALRHGDELLVGRTRLAVDIPSSAA
ncbi:MAG TPA: FHA domain-containing protein [Polyangiaceae bacterium]|nr:FHA domain-containing protein [Polyangiaceae bacterium]